MKTELRIFLLGLAAFAAAACSDSDAGSGPAVNGPITYRSCSDEMRVSTIESTASVKFTVRAPWSARSTDTGWLAIESAASGGKGTVNMKLHVAANDTGETRSADILLLAEGYDETVLVTVVQTDAGSHPDFGVNTEKIDPILSEYYLWNDEYDGLVRDYAQPYDEFVRNTLLGMKTNDLDGGTYADGSRYLYTSISRSAIGRAAVAKQAEISMGIKAVTRINFTDGDGNRTGSIGICLRGVYNDSPASEAGLRRGDVIEQIDGRDITDADYADAYGALLYPSAGRSVTVKVMGREQTATLTAASIYLNPILHSEVIENGQHKIGYLVYADFDAAFESELLDVFNGFKSAGITDLVLDLRLNGGGHVIASQMITSIVAGAAAEGKVFEKMRYNDARMKAGGWSFPDRMECEYFGPGENSGYSASDYLSLSRLYILATGSSASASELTFNALRGINFPVTLIGERTEGKNVGMETRIFEYDGFRYTFLPISFQSYNAKNETCDPAGTAPDYQVDEWTGGYRGWGEAGEPLLEKALQLIAGGRSAAAAAAPVHRNVEFAGNMPVRAGGSVILPDRDGAGRFH